MLKLIKKLVIINLLIIGLFFLLLATTDDFEAFAPFLLAIVLSIAILVLFFIHAVRDSTMIAKSGTRNLLKLVIYPVAMIGIPFLGIYYVDGGTGGSDRMLIKLISWTALVIGIFATVVLLARNLTIKK